MSPSALQRTEQDWIESGSAGIRVVERTACYLCGAEGELFLSKFRDRLFGVPGMWHLRKCSDPNCQLVWLGNCPVEEDIGLLYTRYYTHTAGKPGKTGQNEVRGLRAAVLASAFGYSNLKPTFMGKVLSRSRFVWEVAGASVRWLPQSSGKTLLDVGCGDGGLLRIMRDLGWHVSGVELDGVAARVAQESLGDNVQIADLRNATFPARSFDVITMNHVIEHMGEPRNALAECRRLLKEGGWLVIVTPNIDSLGQRYFGSSWVHWDPPRHFFLYSVATLITLLESAGFEVEKSWTSARDARFAWSASRAIRKYGTVRGEELRGDRGLAKRIAAGLFQVLEHFASARKEVGEEVIVFAKPKA